MQPEAVRSAFGIQVESKQPFTSVDYMAPTPSWAVYGSTEAGFDPGETRVRKIRVHNKQGQGEQ